MVVDVPVKPEPPIEVMAPSNDEPAPRLRSTSAAVPGLESVKSGSPVISSNSTKVNVSDLPDVFVSFVGLNAQAVAITRAAALPTIPYAPFDAATQPLREWVSASFNWNPSLVLRLATQLVRIPSPVMLKPFPPFA